MGHVEVAHVSHVLPDGRQLLDDASFKIPDGATAALVGPNGAGKTTLLRMLAGDMQPTDGAVSISGAVGVMRQFIGGPQAKGTTVRDLLLAVSPQPVRDAARRLDDTELAMMERDDEPTQLRYARALNDYAEVGGYDQEVHWDECCVAAVKKPYDEVKWREVDTLSGGQQKRLVLESLLRSGTFSTLLLDEPDNYLDVPGKRWLEGQLATTPKTVLLVSHDRELLNACAQRIVTVEDGKTWVHGGGFKTSVRHPVRRPAGPAPDPAARTGRRDPALAGRADRQPRPAVRRRSPGRPRGLPGHGPRGNSRPLVRRVIRPLPGLRPRRHRQGIPSPRLGLKPKITIPNDFSRLLAVPARPAACYRSRNARSIRRTAASGQFGGCHGPDAAIQTFVRHRASILWAGE